MAPSHHSAWGEKYFEAIMTPMVPFINVDIAATLRSRDTNMILSRVYKIRNLDRETRTQVIDILTSIVSEVGERDFDMRFNRRLLEGMDKIPSIGQPLRQVISLVEKHSTVAQRAEFLRRGVQLSKTNVRLLYESVQEDIEGARDEDLDDLILSKQAIYEAVKLLDSAYRQMTKRTHLRKVPSDVKRKINMALYLLLRLEAYRLGKIEVSSLHDDLTIASLLTEPTVPEEMLGSIEDVIGILGT
jgi:hypothetical protein